jgi:hypothetical protein
VVKALTEIQVAYDVYGILWVERAGVYNYFQVENVTQLGEM